MRHLVSILVSLLLAPLIWLCVGYGGNRLFVGRTGAFTPQHPDMLPILLGLAGLIVAGLLYAVLVLPRLSPVGPVLVGLVYLGATVWALLANRSFLDLVPSDLGSLKGAGAAPAGGVAAVLAVPLLLTVFSPRRWRRRERTVQQPPATPAYPGPGAPPFGGYPAPPPYQEQPVTYLPAQPDHASEQTRPLYSAPIPTHPGAGSDEDSTWSLYGTPPPPAAYPPPGHAGSTPPPVDPDATRPLS